MKYFVPDLVLGSLAPPQTRLSDKLGGLPWGLPVEKWPLCRECGNPQTHLATFIHSAERLNLGAEGSVVMIFQCGHAPNETKCETYEAEGGANAVIFLDADEISNSLSEPPAPGAPKEIEMRVTGWSERHDLVTAESEASFYEYESWGEEPDEARQAVEDSIEDGARLGSVPCWQQEPEEIDSAFRFAAQLAMYCHFPDPLPTAEAAGATVNRRDPVSRKYVVDEPTHPDPSLRGQIYFSDLTFKRYGSGFDVEAADFGDGGKGFLFIQPDPVAPRGLFLWQCG